MADSPTIVAAHLSDDALKQSVNSLVSQVNDAIQSMATNFDKQIGNMEARLKQFSSTKYDTGGSADGGSSKRTQQLKNEEAQVKATTSSYDQMAKSQQIAVRSGSDSFRNADTLQTMRINLDILREKLLEARGQYSSFVALAAHATTTGDKGLFQFATENVHRYEAEVKNLIPQIRNLQNGIQQMGDVIAPQGHTIQNYINSLQKANPELAALNAQYKSGTSLLHEQASSMSASTVSADKYTEAIKKQAQAIRDSQQWKEKGFVMMGDTVYYDKERANVSKRDKQLLLSLEEQIVQVQQKEAEEARKVAQAEQQNTQAARQTEQAVLGTAAAYNTVDQIAREVLSRQNLATAKAGGVTGGPTTSIFQNYDDLRMSIAAVLKVEQQQVQMANTETASTKQLAASLKQLQDAYSRLSRSDRNSEQGRALRQEIQLTEREIQKLRSEASRPISLGNALKLSEKTLDDIAYKIRMLNSYKMGVTIDEKGKKEIVDVDKAIVKLKKDYDDLMNKNQQMIKSNTALGRSWNYMKNRLAFYFTVGASTSFVKNLIEVRSQYEMNERALGILIDSAERGTRIFNELSQMALVSPYTLIELSTAAKQLTAYDIAAKDVVDTTRRLADMAAAVGIPIERLTYALGQIKAYGYLNARDARMFSNAGIPLVKQLADYYTELEGKMVSTADVYDRIKKKAIGMTDVMQVINKMTDEGGKFFDFQAKMADTLKVQLANLTLAWNNMLNDIGASEQGVISSGIKLLKELFLRWKDVNRAVENIAIALGVAKAAQLVYYGVVMGTNKAIAIETVLGTKLSNVLRNLGTTMNSVLTSGATWWGLIGIAAGAAIIEVIRGNEAMKEFNKTLRENAENTYNDLKKFSEQYNSIRESLYKTENGKQTPVDIDSKEAKKVWEAVREQIELSSHASDEYIGKLLSIENVSERLRHGFAVVDSIQAVSAAIKELGDDTIKLEREWSAWWNLGLLPDGTIGNLKDTHMWLSKIEDKYGSIANARKVASASDTREGFNNVFQKEAKQFVENYEEELEKFRQELQVTKQSVIDFIELKGWSGDASKINEAFRIFTDNLILKSQLNPQQAYTLQLEMEEARSKAAKQALLTRINDEKAALKETRNAEQRAALVASINENVNEYNTWNDFNGRKRVEWERFTKWLKEQHISETTAMFRNMDAEDIKSLNFQEGQHADWVNRMVTQYAKEHKMSYDDAFSYLKSWVTSANQWSIFIPLTISSEDKKTVYQQLGEYDKLVDEADAQIERLTKRIGELKKKKEKDKEETEELTKAENELAKAQRGKADAEAHGGHGKKEKKDTRDAAKEQKQAETELQKALKDEISLIDKVRSTYKTLTKEGVSSQEALSVATEGFSESVKNINAVLGKYGIEKLDLTRYAGVQNPRSVMDMLQAQLNRLKTLGVAKPVEIKDLEVKLQGLKVDSLTFDHKTITSSMNNELSKLKDEYELAVELDANPELGGALMDMFGIDTGEFPHTIGEYMKRVQDEFDKTSKKFGYNTSLEVFKANDKTWLEWGKQVGLVTELLDEQGNVIGNDTEALDSLKTKFVEAQGVAKKWVQDTVKQTQDLKYKLSDTDGKLAIELEKLNRLQEQFVNTSDPKQIELLALQIREEELAIAKLKEEIMQTLPLYKALFSGEFELSANKTNRLAKQYRDALLSAKNGGLDAAGNYTYTDPISGKKSPVNKLQMEKELKNANKLIKQTSSPFKQISEAFKKGADGTNDWARGVELIGEELQKLGGLVGDIGNFAEQLGFDRATVEVINDVASSINGVATVAEGIGQIASGDYIGGAASVLSGVMSTIGSWLDNSDNRIVDEIKASERAVKRLENTMLGLEDAANHAYGAIVSGAQRAVISNKELQLVELKRQIQLEKSRDSKRRDDDRILELEGQYKQLLLEIKNGIEDVVNEMLGISSAGDAITQLVEAMVEAFKNGEDAMQAFSDKWDEMIDNMILKLIVSQYMKTAWDKVMQTLKEKEEEMLSASSSEAAAAQAQIDNFNNMSDEEKARFFGIATKTGILGGFSWDANELKKLSDNYIKSWTNVIDGANSANEKASEDYLKWSLDYMMGEGRNYMQEVGQNLIDGLGEWYTYGQNGETSLSALQAGIQGITEDTAGAIEAYLNIVSQRIFMHTDLLTEIRDALVAIDSDAQLGVFSQILLQLQNSYQVLMTIQNVLDGWSTPSGQAVRVELTN